MTAGETAQALLDRILAPDPPPYALLYRPGAMCGHRVEILTGTVSEADRIADIPVSGSPRGPAGTDVLALLPYRQLAERGFPAPDDGQPLVIMTVDNHAAVDRAEVLDRIPDVPIHLANGHFEIGDDAYARLVRRIQVNEINAGAGSNFVLMRRFAIDITNYSPAIGAAFFRRLIVSESGAYWTFLVRAGQRTLVGASPERHISLDKGLAVMNPISGTYRYPPSGPTLAGVQEFLADRKEKYELYMVVDEELKMMSQICDRGVRVVGPFLKEMARLAHTEYFIEGRTQRDLRDILRMTLFAPTVTGSPLENASRVISRYEPQGRGYYGGVIALIGRDGQGQRTLDSSILIRTAEIDNSGHVTIGVGATLVRDSEPTAEVAETKAKATGLLTALHAHPVGSLGRHPSIRSMLRDRNAGISRFWLRGTRATSAGSPALAGRHVLVIDAEDEFTAMIAHQLRSVGLRVTVCRFDEPYRSTGHDLTLLGPGPGDPLDTGAARIAHLHREIQRLLDDRRPFLAVCLSHQILSHQLGLEVAQRDPPFQGVQKEIEFFGRREHVGFYNSFAARSAVDWLCPPRVGPVEVCRDVSTGEVHALRGPHFASVQFHAESVLTRDGVRIFGRLIADILAITRHPVAVTGDAGTADTPHGDAAAK